MRNDANDINTNVDVVSGNQDNIDINPYVDSSYHLSSTSQAIDAGYDPSQLINDQWKDIDKQHRPADDIWDIGVDEVW